MAPKFDVNVDPATLTDDQVQEQLTLGIQELINLLEDEAKTEGSRADNLKKLRITAQDYAVSAVGDPNSSTTDLLRGLLMLASTHFAAEWGV